jgi:hypothetical protein
MVQITEIILWRIDPLLGKDSVNTPVQANAHKNRMFITRQRISKHASLTTEDVFSMRFMQSINKEVFGSKESSQSEKLSFGTPSCQGISLELNWVKSSELTAAE